MADGPSEESSSISSADIAALSFWKSSNIFKRICKRFTSGTQGNFKSIGLSGLVSPALPSFIAALSCLNRPLVVITPEEQPANIKRLTVHIQQLISTRLVSVDALHAIRATPLEALHETGEHYPQLMNCLLRWYLGKPSVTICSARSILQPIPSREALRIRSLELQLGKAYSLVQIYGQLSDLGYKREDTVLSYGSFSARGDVLDIYTANFELPVRLNFFGDELESIKRFEPWSQRSIDIKSHSSLHILPVHPFSMSRTDRLQLLPTLESLAEELDLAHRPFWMNDLGRYIEDGEEWERFAPWLCSSTPSTILQHLPPDALVILNDSEAIAQRISATVKDLNDDLNRRIEAGTLPRSQRKLLQSFVGGSFDASHLLAHSIDKLHLHKDSTVEAEFDLDMRLLPQFRANLTEAATHIAQLQRSGMQVFISTESPKELSSIEGLQAAAIEYLPNMSLERGFSTSDAALFTDLELLARKPVLGRARQANRRPADFIPIDLDTMRTGDFVVHLKHGIGKFVGLKTIELTGHRRDYISVEYQRGELLNVPVDQMNLLTLYRGNVSAPKLSKLGGLEWEKTKRNVKASLEAVAEELIELYAERALRKGHVFAPDTPWQTEMEEDFPYSETADQLSAIEDIKKDLEAGKIMDRLLCGDVGFGKTEVMIRTAFKVIMEGKQVALLAPTTILAHQHFKSIKARLERFPTRIELLSRARSTQQKAEITRKLIAGEIDLVVGTHALLAKGVDFRDLGILIIDEEQKFGVKHKEKLKQLRKDVPVLTVSATPIPRTMHMSLSGIKEMSLIRTPPPGRAPIKTQILKHKPEVVRAAILREIERGGQVFYLHNRVESIERKAMELMALVPEASFRIAHGQMSEDLLSEIMVDFMDGNFDVLLATSIIENGLDIPNANTMIIEDAHKFGLAQLHQLRGRVGRSSDPGRGGYALLLVPNQDGLTETSKARLETISRYSGLGSGYQIALRDLEIRGGGDMLGGSQHGKKIDAIGLELYCEMLEEAIARLRRTRPELSAQSDKTTATAIMDIDDKPELDFKIEAHLPADWMEEDTLRLREYSRLAKVSSIAQLNVLQDEWSDRFGKFPQPVCDLLRVIRVRILAGGAGIKGLIRPKGDLLELQTFMSFAVWRRVSANLPDRLLRRVVGQFPKEGAPRLLVKLSEMNKSEQLDLLIELFELIGLNLSKMEVTS